MTLLNLIYMVKFRCFLIRSILRHRCVKVTENLVQNMLISKNKKGKQDQSIRFLGLFTGRLRMACRPFNIVTIEHNKIIRVLSS